MDITNRNKSKQQGALRVKPQVDLTSMAYGKIPPQAIDLEEAILGAIMLEKGVFDVVSEILNPSCFYVDAHQRIFRAMQTLANQSQAIDLLTVVNALKTSGELDIVGGPFFVTKLTNAVVSSANVETHSRIVLQKFLQRELIKISSETIKDAYEDTIDVFTLLDDAESRLFEITNNHLKKNFDSLSTVLSTTMNRISEMRMKNDEITGVPTGFPQLDHVTYGWQPTDLIILAARPSVGKTAFALNLARSAALHKRKPTAVGFFSLEMSNTQLVQRILSAESEIPLGKITRGKLEEYEMAQLMERGMNRLIDAPIYIDDTPALNIFELRAKCRRLKNKHNIGLVIIDYLQLMSGSSENRNSNREQEISKISRDLKGLAKELSIPIIALSQLSREVEKRKEGNKIPQLSDLRESGAIEQDADMVMFLYRPGYYNISYDEHGENIDNLVQVKIAKHRNGSLETINLEARLDIQKFVEGFENIDPETGKMRGSGGKRPSAIFNNPAAPQDGSEQRFVKLQSRMNEDRFGKETGDDLEF